MNLKSINMFKYRNDLESIKKSKETHANISLLEYLSRIQNFENNKIKSEVRNVPFLPVDRIITEEEVKEILKALETFLPTGEFTSGKYIEIFENQLTEYLEVKNVITISSGTNALTIGLLALGVSKGDEVIIPSNSFAATENAVMSIGAIPVFVDIKNDFTICPEAIKKSISKKTKAILPVHLYGRYCEMDKIREVSKKYNIPLIEDACQGIGLENIAEKSDMAVLSFNPYKNLGVCGKAGAIITNNDELANTSRILSYHGFDIYEKNKKVRNFGFNAKIDNTQALIGSIRLKRLTFNNYKRLKIAEKYNQHLSQLQDIILPKFDENSVWHLYPIRIKNRKRDTIKDLLEDKGIHTEIYYPYLSHKQQTFNKKIHLKNTEKLHSELLCLPIYPNLTIDEQKYIIKNLKKSLEKSK